MINHPNGQVVQAERSSIIGLRSLLIQAVEALSFILLLIDFRLPDIVATCVDLLVFSSEHKSISAQLHTRAKASAC